MDPITGSGGTVTNMTFAASTSSPLIDNASFLMTQSNASTGVGQGVSCPFTVDSGKQVNVLGIKFWYNASASPFVASSGAVGSDSSVEVYVYDITNSVLIPIAGRYITAQGSNNYVLTGTFQTAYNSTSYRLIVAQSAYSSSTSSWTFKWDGLFVGSQTTAQGPPVTDFGSVPWTPTGSWTTNTTYTGEWGRVGDTMRGRVHLALSGAPTNASLTINLPSGYTIDTTKLSNTTGVTALGAGTAVAAGTDFVSTVAMNSTTSLLVSYEATISGTNPQAIQYSPTASGSPKTWTSGDSVDIMFEVPIVGWSSSTTMSADTDTREVALVVTKGSTQAVTANTTNVSFTTINKDTHGGWNGTDTYTVPVSGDYQISAPNLADNADATTASFKAYVNGSLTQVVSSSAVAGFSSVGSVLLNNLHAGDTITIRSSATITLSANGTLTLFRVSGPAVVAATESVALSYQMATGQSLTSAATIKWDTKLVDSHNAYNSSTGVWTAPSSGKYSISYQLISINDSSGQWQTAIRKNSSSVARCNIAPISNAGSSVVANQNVCIQSPVILQLNAGDTIDIYIIQTATTATLYTNILDTAFSIVRIGN